MTDEDDPPSKRSRLLEAEMKLNDIFNITDRDRVIVKYAGVFECSSQGEEVIDPLGWIPTMAAVAGSLISESCSGPGPDECRACSRLELKLTNYASTIRSLTADNLREYSDSLKCILGSHSIRSGIVAVGVQPGCLLPVALLGILKAGAAFYPVSHKKPFSDCVESREVVQFDWLLADQDYVMQNSVMSYVFSCHPIAVGCGRLWLLKLKETVWKVSREYSPYEYAYVIRTSGTTGNRRIVFVPHEAIVLNVLDLVGEFRLDSTDVVVGIAPPTFDPSIIDLFMALNSGARIVYIADQVKLESNALIRLINEEQVTFIQCTPSFLFRIGEDKLREMMSSINSKLKIIALGGERCPHRNILRRMIPQAKMNEVKIFNLYGITEVSCWASVEKINFDENEDDIALGRTLTSIRVQVVPSANKTEGEICIGFASSRKCTIFTEDGFVLKPFAQEASSSDYEFFQTGDLGKKQGGQLFYIGRLDRIRKRNGIKIDLQLVEDVTLEIDSTIDAFCTDLNQRIVLAVKLKSRSDQAISSLYEHLKTNLPFEYYPDQIVITTNDLPLNENGKFDWPTILRTCQVKPCNSVDFAPTECEFKNMYYKLWNLYTSRETSCEPAPKNSNFVMQGGTSITVNLFVEDFFSKIQRFGSSLHLEYESRVKCALLTETAENVEELLRDIVSQGGYARNLTAVSQFSSDGACPSKIRAIIDQKKISEPPSCALQLPVQSLGELSIPIGLCVDGTPVVTSHPTEDEVCLIGSHSGALYCFSLSKLAKTFPWKEEGELISKGMIVWKTQLPGRIESAVTANYASCSGYIGCHDGKLYKFSVIDGSKEWTFDVGAELRASPALSACENFVVIDTSNIVYCLDARVGLILWIKNSPSYVFQTLSPVISDESVFFCTINGITALSLTRGEELWTLRHENIRTSPLLVKLYSMGNGDKDALVFGDSSGSIFAIEQATSKLMWSSPAVKSVLPNQLIYHEHISAARDEITVRQLLFTTNDGHVHILDAETGLRQYQINLEVEMRCRPFVFDLKEKNDLESVHLMCCCVFSSKEGNMFACLVPNDPATSSGISASKLFNFGNDGAESFSSPVLSKRYKILIVGSRDNCVHFAKLH